MDLPAVLARRPELCLIDELAHTNAPGIEHAKRYEDVDDVLAAGIDVFSTVNVQHLESLNDQVAELTGVRVRETLPDRVLGRGGRGRDRRPHARGADRPPARGQDLPARPRAGGAQRLLQGREPRRPARGRAAAGRRGGRVQAPDTRRSDARRAAVRPRPRRPSRSACWRSSSAAVEPADRAPCLALGPAPRRDARRPLGRAGRARAERRASASSSKRCAAWLRCSARTCSSSTATSSRSCAGSRATAERHTC